MAVHNIILISGPIGSGKTRFSQMIQKYPFAFGCSRGVLVMELDEIVGMFHALPFFQKQVSEKIGYPLKQKLFYSSGIQRQRNWEYLESIFHPSLTSFLAYCFHQAQKEKYALVVDMALPHLLPQNTPITRYHLGQKKLYPLLFSLKKYRGTPARESLVFLRRYFLHCAK